ncbi:MAG: hypothetical protein GC165_17120 [Armatimonadetes bacterium]|nr:hypothetical protein [Armatimonadota bacterium]MBS1727226.1 hypothetical protein [Armatimonadota bacterium]
MRAFEPWQLDQLGRIGEVHPARLEELLQALWNRYPFLYEELAIGAVERGTLSLDEAAVQLGISSDLLQEKVTHYKSTGDHRITVNGGVARLASSHVAVWEVYRDFEKSGNLDHLMSTFPGIPISELKAALRYAEAHPEEIRELIDRYESTYRNRFVV